jgi:hypothetical protein
MATQRITFGAWQPDSADFTGQNATTLHQAYNVYSSAVGYAPFPKAVRVSEALPKEVNSVFVGKYGADIQIFAGAKDSLYNLQGVLRAGTINDVTNPNGYASSVTWDFCQFGQTVLATSGQKVQQYTIGVSNTFTDVDESPASTCIAIVRDFVFANDVDNPSLVKWSDINNHENWTPSPTSQADSQYLADGGAIVNIMGGEQAIILMEKAVIRGSYIGSPFFFQFDLVSRIGCFEKNSCVQNSGVTYFLSESGFMMTDGSTVKPIGAGIVDNFFWADVDLTEIATMSTAVHPLLNLVVWNYKNNSGRRALLTFNFVTGQWSYGETVSQVVGSLMSQGTSLDALDSKYPILDNMEISLDSRLFIGGKALFAGAEGQYIISYEGEQDESYLTTNDLEFGNNSTITLARPMIDNGSAEFQIASRRMLNDNVLFSDKSVTSEEGRADLRSSGKYHRVRVHPLGSGWTHAVGFDIDYAVSGTR